MSSSAGGNMEEVVEHRQQLDYGGGGGGSNNPRRCAACKYLRRRCAPPPPPDCVLAPYFPASQPRRYADVHTVFGTSNVTKGLPVQERGRAADTMATEARWRAQNPVYGCTGVIDRLQQEIRAVQHELARTRAQLTVHARGAPLPPPPGTQPPMLSLPPPPPPQPLAAAAAVAVHDGDDEAPLMDPEEFLDLDGRF
ncbi:hypothetical protein C2845_PM14G18500 [Panicum miliaceum]|uniref:LOB domain-containing protein n=1 Tax=Panicum miliaceum TaxID=4540 RepID=A0A3L6PP14_PANMI|nr:hypothetical protein C2845_PM14G18500 [Panicum miliaceum]